MEKQPSYVLMLSLEQMALRRVAVALYSEPRFSTWFAMLKLNLEGTYQNIWHSRDSNWGFRTGLKLHETVEGKMLQLQLPKPLSKKLMPILHAVGSELYTWKSIHEEYLSDSGEAFIVCVLQKLCWTTAGTVDYRKTAEQLVCCDLLDVAKRFKLACLYCVEDQIPFLWEELSEEKKMTFCESPVETPDLQQFLPCILDKQSKIDSVRALTTLNFFEESALRGNKTLAEYCFWKLPKEEREASLVLTAKIVIKCRDDVNSSDSDFRRKKLSDVLFYLLSLMTPGEQTGIFRQLTCQVLRCFLDWPWQDLISDFADVIWTSIPESEYLYLLCTITNGTYHVGYWFPNCFQDLFLSSPIEFKKIFLDEEIRGSFFFPTFFRNEDIGTIKVIFRNVDAADRVRLVSSECGLKIIDSWGWEEGTWHLVEEFLREARLSKKDKERLKEDFVAMMERDGRMKWARENYRSFFEFVEETDGNKRSWDDETGTKTKKLCCEKEENSTELRKEGRKNSRDSF